MAKARSRIVTGAGGGSDEEMLVRLFRVLTDEQFDYWIACLNRAVAAMGGRPDTFTRDDRQKTISYWYLLMFLLESYAARENPFGVRKGETWLSDGLLSMSALSRHFRDRYKEETIRRYVFDLKQCGLIALDGRGAEATLRLSAPAILALADTIRQWVTTFRDVDRRISKLRVF
ncbi:hypothetical protein [Hyphomicrobium sp.]|uniref:hypothetical protein n=1 Tax=Hyphomicrobium sp. TaxID=82 RepID=UPI0025B90DBE|nr:hypothetical protein [Hyphomicrobium sp.]MCC7250817.1 hypothetical protein [Hyphomicrobium sp.]